MNKIITIVIVMFLVVLNSQSGFSQKKIEGVVYSSHDGEALGDVKVYVDDNTSKHVCISKEDGSFDFEYYGSKDPLLTFRRIGYLSKSILWKSEPSPFKVVMEENLPNSEEIIVNGTLKEGDDMLSSFYITSNLNSIDELISKTSGMTIVKRGNFASEPVIRGMNSDRINITINGMKIQSACTDKMDPVTSYAETDNLKSISISRGSFDADHCGNMQSGIDLKLKDAETFERTDFSGSFSAGYLSVSQGNNLEGSFDLNTPAFGSAVNFAYRSSGDYKTGNGEVVPYSGFNKINFSNSNILDVGKNSSIKADILYDYAWDIGYPALTMDVKDAEALITGLEFESFDVSSFIRELDARVYYNKVTHIMDDSQRDNRIKMDMPGWTQTLGAYLISTLDAGGTELNAKADFSLVNAKAEMTMYVPGSIPMYMLTWPDVDKTDGTLSLGTTKQLLSKLSLSVNGWGGFVNTSIDNEIGMGELMIFYPDFTGKDSRFVGGVSAGFRYFPSDDISAGINYSFNKRSHTISEQYAFYIFNRLDSYDYVGDPYLKNETVNQFELNVLANTGKLRLETSAFGYFFSDYILGEVNESLSAMTEGSRGVKIYQNIPSAKLLGFEQTADYQISSKFRAINNIQYTYGVDDLGEYLPQIPPLMGSLSIRFSEQDFLVQAETVWAAAQRNVNEIYGESQSPSFVVFNLRGSLKLFEALSVDAGVENIFDMLYYEHLDWQQIPRPGRNLYVSLKTGF